MGFWKNRLIRLGELGLSASFDASSDRRVCSCCVADQALSLYLSRLGPIDACDFCRRTDTSGATVEALFEYMIGCVLAEWDDPINEVGWDSGEGGWVGAPVIATDELLYAIGEPLAHAELRELFVDSIEHDWCQRNPYALAPDERLHLSWAAFASCVRHEHRYLFLRTARRSGDPELVEPAAMLDELGKAIHNVGHEVLRTLPVGSPLIRARLHNVSERLQAAADLGSPPLERTRPTRMSPAGISMFYAAEDTATALAELRPASGEWATTATWRTLVEIPFLDLADLPEVPSLFDMTARYQRTWISFLRGFAEEIARPSDGDADIDYVPTQILTEYVRDVLTDPHGRALLGIRYRSSMKPEGVCWVLFAGPETCAGSDTDDNTTLVLSLDFSTIQRFQPWWREA